MSLIREVGNFSYDPNKILGKGSSGTFVFRGFYRDVKPIAVKRVQRSSLSADLDILQWEVELMRKTSGHSNILRCIGTAMNDDYL